MTSFSALVVLLALVSVAKADVAPIDTHVCPNGYDITDPIPALGQYAFQVGTNYQNPPTTWQFTGNLVHYNAASGQLMGGGIEGPFFKIINPGHWTPGGALDYSFNVYSDAGRLHQIGTGTIHSDLFFTNPIHDNTDNYDITFAGGAVMLTTTITDTSTNNPGYAHVSDPTYANFRPLSKMIFFQPFDSMPGVFPKPLMNRLISKAQAALYPNNAYFNGAFSTTVTTDNVMVLWGSDGYNSDSQTFTAPSTGMDLVLKLTCSAGPNPNDGGPVPTGPCPDGVDCGGAVFMANYPSCAAPVNNPIVGSNKVGSCVTLSFVSSGAGCPR